MYLVLHAHGFQFLLFQIVQELEKQRIELLCNILNRYNLQMYSFGQTVKHVSLPASIPQRRLNHFKDINTHPHLCYFQGQTQIEQAVQRVDMDKDIQALVEENRNTTEDHKAEFLMTDYFVSLRICCCILKRRFFSARGIFLMWACELQKKLLTQPDGNPVLWSTVYLLLYKWCTFLMKWYDGKRNTIFLI